MVLLKNQRLDGSEDEMIYFMYLVHIKINVINRIDTIR